ncbi:MAG TPA: WecB/TagA/CpsF family glycosyltransferase [Intrasporangium sp.]|uniref:WecB/TagA/CpsF family glycosyltransferase n=1 Tax=Intrasporangium sp. TaxID=1925024 RepID=UPI002D773894|nr:WecB/TagA/CpsF family glycosyltransferase [Intrasporangium sp.]HET7398578.1 WecB/TagA/CpsF family glycosyltransferase [Intrasporangium sp.]
MTRPDPAASQQRGPGLPARVRVPYLLTEATPMSEAEVVDLVLSRPRPVVRVGNLNLHAVHLYLTDEGFRRYTDAADVVLADGWPVWAALHRANPALDSSFRVGSSDWLFRVLDADPELRVLAVGASPESSARAAAAATARAPRVRWVAFDGYTFAQQDAGPPTTVEQELPLADLVLVGMGMGAQERWIEEHQGAMTHGVIANVGGCLDYLSGEQVHAPRWVGRMGLEWLYRLLANPSRNARRVFVEPLQLAAVLRREARSRRR